MPAARVLKITIGNSIAYVISYLYKKKKGTSSAQVEEWRSDNLIW